MSNLELIVQVDRLQKSMGVGLRIVLAVTRVSMEKHALYIEQSCIQLHISIRGIRQVLTFNRDSGSK